MIFNVTSTSLPVAQTRSAEACSDVRRDRRRLASHRLSEDNMKLLVDAGGSPQAFG